MNESAMGVLSLMVIGDDGVSLEEQSSTHGLPLKMQGQSPIPGVVDE